MHLYINDEIETFDLASALPQLSAQRREQTLRFRYETGQKLCAAAYLLLRQGLHEAYGIDACPQFTYGEHGKPSIIGHPEIHFNISHCPKAVICVLSSQPVGVDIERFHEAKESLVRYTMNDSEYKIIMESPRSDMAFTRLWTMKEALMKQQGTGI